MIDEANIGIAHSERALSDTSSVIKPHDEVNDTTNPIAPIKTTAELVKKLVFPENFESVKTLNYPLPSLEKIYGDEQRKLELLKTKFKEVSERMFRGIQPSSKNSVKVIPLVSRAEETAIISANAIKIQNQYMG